MENRYKAGLYTVYLEDKEGSLNTYVTMAKTKIEAFILAMKIYAQREDNIDKEYVPIDARLQDDTEFTVSLVKPEASLF